MVRSNEAARPGPREDIVTSIRRMLTHSSHYLATKSAEYTFGVFQSFRERLRALREERALRVGGLANAVGDSDSAIRQMESGQTKSASFAVGAHVVTRASRQSVVSLFRRGRRPSRNGSTFGGSGREGAGESNTWKSRSRSAREYVGRPSRCLKEAHISSRLMETSSSGSTSAETPVGSANTTTPS